MKKTIIIVEMYSSITETIKREIRKIAPDAEFHVATEPNDALELMASHPPDLITVDGLLRSGHGAEVLGHMPENLKSKCIAITHDINFLSWADQMKVKILHWYYLHQLSDHVRPMLT